MGGRATHELVLLARAGTALLLLGLSAALFLGSPLDPATARGGLALLVLGAGCADALGFLLEFGRELRAGSSLARAAALSLGIARRRGSVVTGGFAIAWLVLTPQGATAIVSFALLEGIGVLINAAVLGLGDRVRRGPAAPVDAPGAHPPRRTTARLAAALGSCAAVAAILGTAGWSSFHSDPARQLACPLLPSGVVPATGMHIPDCPFQPFDRVIEVWVPGDRGPFRDLADLREKAQRWPEFVEWTVERGGQRVTGLVPVVEAGELQPLGRFTTALLMAGILLATGLIIAWNTASVAAVPFLLFYSIAAVWLASTLCAGSNEYLHLVAALAAAMLGSPLAHLALVFPRERVARPSAVPAVYYGAGALLGVLTAVGFQRSAELWILLERLVPILVLLAWSAMLLSALAVLQDPISNLERARARIALIGSAAMAALALGTGSLAGEQSAFAYRAGAVVLLPLPVAAALVRYHVFDMHPRLRRVISSLAYSALAAGVLTLFAVAAASAQHTRAPLGDVGLLFSALLVLLLAAEPLRSWFQGRARELVSGAARRRRAAAVRCMQQLAELRDPDACARILAETIVESLRCSWVAVFLRSRELGLRPSHAVGEGAPLSLDLARRADLLAHSGTVVHLSRAGSGGAAEALVRSGVDVVMRLRSAAGTAGVVLIGERDEAVPYTLEELEYLGALGAQGGVALENARLARELVDAERTAARGNLAVGLAHELGKPLRVIEDIARSLAGRVGETERTRRDLGQIAAISQELIEAVYGFVQEARSKRTRGGTALADVVARAVHTIRHLHGTDRISISLAPDLPDVVGGDELVTVLSCLLDNALLASRPDDSVHLVASADEGELRLEVVDDGHGMDDSTAARAFELFFTTRADQGGNGVGLSLCREIVEHLGGHIELRSRPRKGTRVTVRLPHP